MQIPILSGIYADSAANFRDSYPVNLQPVITDTGLSKGFLRSEPGIIGLGMGPGQDRGAINWQGDCYRVMGTRLVRISGGAYIDIGDVGPGGPVAMDYSFTQLAINSGTRLYLYDGATLVQVTDPDLGIVYDVIWIDGYFMTTDGSALVVTELNDPTSVDPLKYGSSEADPDPIVGLIKVRNEAYAVNSNTIENFQNVGGSGFPFRRNPGGLIPKGCIGYRAKAPFLDSFAFVGSGRDEAISVYLASFGQAVPISTPEIDRLLGELSANDQAAIEVESRTEKDEQRLFIHLPNQTLVYSQQASLASKSPVWNIIAGGVMADQRYPARHFTLIGAQWIGGAIDGQFGYLSESVETQFGKTAGWRFNTALIYNAAKGGIIRMLELIGLPGRCPVGVDPTMFLSFTTDGQTYSLERAISMGATGQRNKRMQWRPKIRFANYIGARVRGANTGLASFARLEGEIEPLNV